MVCDRRRFPTYTVECCYSTIQHNMILDMVQQWLKQNMHQRFHSPKTPHISPLRVRYGLSFVRIWVKIDHFITALHCIYDDELIGSIRKLLVEGYLIHQQTSGLKMSSYEYRNSHCGDKMVFWRSSLHNNITGESASLYWVQSLIYQWLSTVIWIDGNRITLISNKLDKRTVLLLDM